MLLTRLAFFLALPFPLTRCSGAIVPKLFPSSSNLQWTAWVQIMGSQPSLSAALAASGISRLLPGRQRNGFKVARTWLLVVDPQLLRQHRQRRVNRP